MTTPTNDRSRRWQSIRAWTLLLAGFVLVGCVPTTAPVHSVGTVTECPDQFTDYVQKAADLERRPGTATDVGVDSFTALPEIHPVCVVAFAGTRTLPSGQPEPIQYTALTEGLTLTDAATLAADAGYTTPQPTENASRIAYRKGDTFLTITTRTGTEIGLPGDANTYLILTTFTSEEINKLRPNP